MARCNHPHIRAFLAPKKGEPFQTCQDSLAFQDKHSVRFAIADGVSQSSFPAIWSQLLVSEFCKSGMTRFIKMIKSSGINKLATTWKTRCTEQDNSGIPSFFLKKKLEQPAFSTFIGIQLFNITKHKSKFFVAAVGDSCLFRFENQKFQNSYPQTTSTEFSGLTEAIGTDSKTKAIQTFKGNTKWGDTFVLATDALAKWLMERIESEDSEQINELLTVSSQSKFFELIQKYRDHETMPLDDDDAALMIVDISKVAKAPVFCSDDWKKDYNLWLSNKEASTVSVTSNPPTPPTKDNKKKKTVIGFQNIGAYLFNPFKIK